MTNGHMEGINGSAGATVLDPISASDLGDIENTMEHKLMRAFAQRRQLKRSPEALEEPNPAETNPAANAPAPDNEGTAKEPNRKGKNKRKKGWRRIPIIGKCISPKTEEPEPEPKAAPEPEPKVLLRSFLPEKTAENEFEKVAKRLTGIADEVEFIATDEYESDGGEGDLEKMIGLLLRESGDMLNQKMEEEKVNPTVLFSYSFFENLLTTFLERIGYRNSRSDDLRPQASTETQVAVACEITSRLSAVDTLPSSRMLNFGAAYLRQHYSHWVQEQSQHEAELHSGEEEEEEVE
uniref:Apoptosis facilitator Bcl-2-like protein 14 n=1 Tax=Oryzias latipes TaxID=8090 RepID=A0A3P9KE64_ORYLA